MLRATGLDGDGIGDPSVHGGPDKAVYLYAAADYAWWRTELGRDVPDGLFGENLTVGGDGWGEVGIGTIFRVGGARIMATEPREPCFKLGIRMEDQGFLRRFRDAGRTGIYARVLEEGPVAAGDAIEELESADPRNISVAELHRLYVAGRRDSGGLRAALDSPDLTDGWREWAQNRLAELERSR